MLIHILALGLAQSLVASDSHKTALVHVTGGDLPAATTAWAGFLGQAPGGSRTVKLAMVCSAATARDAVIRINAEVKNAPLFVVRSADRRDCFAICYGLAAAEDPVPTAPARVLQLLNLSQAPTVDLAQFGVRSTRSVVVTEADITRDHGEPPPEGAAADGKPGNAPSPGLPEGFEAPPRGLTVEEAKRAWTGVWMQAFQYWDDVREEQAVLKEAIRSDKESLTLDGLSEEQKAAIREELPGQERELRELTEEMARREVVYGKVDEVVRATVGDE